ncbi:MAG: hypothetical protein M3279_10275 [Actinomycetota bacterium]|nr:hypothetical protein [Actinomycetota bacterium]
MDEKAEDEILLRLTVEHLLAARSWPTLEYIHRRIHQDLGEEVQVRDVARRLAPHPFFSGYHDLGDVFAPPLTVLARVSQADVLIEALLRLIVFARDKYLSSSGEVEIREPEFAQATALRDDVAAAVRVRSRSWPMVVGRAQRGGTSGFQTTSCAGRASRLAPSCWSASLRSRRKVGGSTRPWRTLRRA